ncbi:MAG: hypothetical protein ACPGTO_01280 [Polaribacter sp.]
MRNKLLKLKSNVDIRPKTETVPVLTILLKSKDIDSEIKKIRRDLKDGHEAELIPNAQFLQNGDNNYHYINQLCAISSMNSDEVLKSDYKNYIAIESQWEYIISEKFEDVLPESKEDFYAISDTIFDKMDGYFASITLYATEEFSI